MTVTGRQRAAAPPKKVPSRDRPPTTSLKAETRSRKNKKKKTAQGNSERVVFLMSPAFKRRLESAAATAGISVGEYLRRAVNAYGGESPQDETALRDVAAALRESTARAHQALDAAFDELRLTREYFDAKGAS